MSKYCSMCGSPLPDSHNHKTCSMCYGDIDYGTDGYYRQFMEESAEQFAYDEEQRRDEERGK